MGGPLSAAKRLLTVFPFECKCPILYFSSGFLELFHGKLLPAVDKNEPERVESEPEQ